MSKSKSLKAICGGFYCGNGIGVNGKTLYMTTPLPKVEPLDEGKVLGVKDGEMALIRKPLTFIAAEAGSTVAFTHTIDDASKATPLDVNLEYSTDGETWNNWAYDTPITLANVGDRVMVCGNNPQGLGYAVGTTNINAAKNHNKFVMTGKIKCFGDVLSLISEDMSVTDISNTYYCFAELFRNCSSLLNAPALGAQKLGDYCYYSLFQSCTSLITPPAVPCTELATDCYDQMFILCTGLKTAPILPALELKDGCYRSMFYGCSSLTKAPELLAMSVPYRAYYSMFYQCASLTKFGDILPALSLGKECYAFMFQESGLTTIPDISAIELAELCCTNMFTLCHGLTDLGDKVLPAVTPAESCYYKMFMGCSNLVTPPEVMLTSLTKRCLSFTFGGNSTYTTPITSIKVHFTEWDTVNTGNNNATYGLIHTNNGIHGKFYCPASLPDIREDDSRIPVSWEKIDI